MDTIVSRRTALRTAGIAGLAAAALAGGIPGARAHADEQAGAYMPGTYTASADGFHGPVTLSFTVGANAIEAIDVVESNESLTAGKVAIERMSQKVLETQSLGIDTVAGATISSMAFLTIAENCMEQAGADLKALTAPLPKEVSSEPTELDVDVAVVGAGLAGLSAAVSAVENGASVVVLEKLGLIGGNAAFSLGTFMICQVEENEPYHINDEDDSLDAAMGRWMGSQDNSGVESMYPDPERLKDQLVQSMFTVDWIKQHGATCEFSSPYDDGHMSCAQVHVPSDTSEGTEAAKLLQLFQNIVLDEGAQLLINTPATELVVDGNAVVGVKADSPAGPITVHAKNVILATGGFAANEKLVNEKLPMLEGLFYIGARGADGSGIEMAEKIGAAPYEDAWINPCWPAPTNAFYFANHYATAFQYQNSPLDDVEEGTYFRLMLDRDGNRFMNEGAYYPLVMITMANYDGAPYWTLYNGLEGKALEIMESGIPTGTVFKGDTLEEVAEAAGISAENLKAAAAEYDKAVEQGDDKQFGKDVKYLTEPIGETGPFFLMQTVVSCSDTLGGIKTNLRRQALDADGNPIPGLYAIGSTSNKSCYNRMLFSGSALTFCATDGRIAGAAAAGVQDTLVYPLA